MIADYRNSEVARETIYKVAPVETRLETPETEPGTQSISEILQRDEVNEFKAKLSMSGTMLHDGARVSEVHLVCYKLITWLFDKEVYHFGDGFQDRIKESIINWVSSRCLENTFIKIIDIRELEGQRLNFEAIYSEPYGVETWTNILQRHGLGVDDFTFTTSLIYEDERDVTNIDIIKTGRVTPNLLERIEEPTLDNIWFRSQNPEDLIIQKDEIRSQLNTEDDF